jgi:hypothetical protein
MQHQARIQDRANAHKAAGAVEQLQGKQMPVPGAKRVHHPLVCHAIRDAPRGRFNRLLLFRQNAPKN